MKLTESAHVIKSYETYLEISDAADVLYTSDGFFGNPKRQSYLSNGAILAGNTAISITSKFK